MKFSSFLVVAAFLLSGLSALGQSHKVVIQMNSDSNKDQRALVSKVNALQDGWGNDVQIAIVFHGAGLAMVNKRLTRYSDEILAIQERGIQVKVCRNSMVGQKLVPVDMLEGVEFVQMGLKEIILLQEAGWSYYQN